MTDLVDDFLIHHGVKGMKWGKRKSEHSSDSSGSSSSNKRLSRKEVRKINRVGQQEHDIARLNGVVAESLKKGDGVLISTMMQGDYVKTIMTGKEFINHVSKGNLVNARMTDVFAAQTRPNSEYVLRDNSNANYQKVKR